MPKNVIGLKRKRSSPAGVLKKRKQKEQEKLEKAMRSSSEASDK